MAHMTVARIESQTINRRAMTARTKLLTICASRVLLINSFKNLPDGYSACRV